MQKEDLVIEFHKKINLVEKKFFSAIHLRRQAQKELWDRFNLATSGVIESHNPEIEIIQIPFNYEFYINGYKCKIGQFLEIEILE